VVDLATLNEEIRELLSSDASKEEVYAGFDNVVPTAY
jgi:hypothetical protein